MPSLQVKNLPEPIYQKLKQEAEIKHRTITQQAIITLANGLKISLDPKRRRKKILAELRLNAQKISHYPLTDPVVLMREDRKR